MSQFISLQDAMNLTSQFRANKENILAAAYKNIGTLPMCETLDRGVFDDLLAQTDCKKIRVYLGMDGNNKVNLVIVGVDSNDEDILTTGAELIAEDGHRSPPNSTPPPSDLNS